jgi:hypothetical protein
MLLATANPRREPSADGITIATCPYQRDGTCIMTAVSPLDLDRISVRAQTVTAQLPGIYLEP